MKDIKKYLIMELKNTRENWNTYCLLCKFPERLLPRRVKRKWGDISKKERRVLRQLAGNDACDIHSRVLSSLPSLSENSRLSCIYVSNGSRIVFEKCALFSFHRYYISIFSLGLSHRNFRYLQNTYKWCR